MFYDRIVLFLVTVVSSSSRQRSLFNIFRFLEMQLVIEPIRDPKSTTDNHYWTRILKLESQFVTQSLQPTIIIELELERATAKPSYFVTSTIFEGHCSTEPCMTESFYWNFTSAEYSLEEMRCLLPVWRSLKNKKAFLKKQYMLLWVSLVPLYLQYSKVNGVIRMVMFFLVLLLLWSQSEVCGFLD
jgi:hypothetical protein